MSLDENELFAWLERDHRDARGLLEQLAAIIDDDPAGAHRLAQLARVQILAHAHAEARTLYAALEVDADEDAADLGHEGREEHGLIEGLLDELDEARVVDEAFRAKVEVLRGLFDRHVADEEGAMFAAARRVLGTERLAQVMSELALEKERELERLGESEAVDEGEMVMRGVD